MTKVLLDFGKVKSNIQTDLNNVVSDLSTSSDKFGSLNCPSGFRYASYLNSLSGLIKDYSKDCKKIANDIDTYYNNFISFNNSGSEMISSVNIYEVASRANHVNKMN